MNRNESLQLQLATIIQEGHTAKATAYDTAGRVLLAMYGDAFTHEGYAEIRHALDTKKYPALPENSPAP